MSDSVLNDLSLIFKVSPVVLFICIMVFVNMSKKKDDDSEERDFKFQTPTAGEADAAERLLAQKKRYLKIVDIAAVPIVLFIVGETYYIATHSRSDASISIIGGADAPTFAFLLSEAFPFVLLTIAIILAFVAANITLLGRINDIKEGRYLVARCTVIDRSEHRGPKNSKYYVLTLKDPYGTTDELKTNLEVYKEADIGSECLVVRFNSEDKINEGRRGRKIKHREVIPL